MSHSSYSGKELSSLFQANLINGIFICCCSDVYIGLGVFHLAAVNYHNLFSLWYIYRSLRFCFTMLTQQNFSGFFFINIFPISIFILKIKISIPCTWYNRGRLTSVLYNNTNSLKTLDWCFLRLHNHFFKLLCFCNFK